MYKYLNINPKLKEENDCVCRAISLATGKDYYFIEYLLYNNATENDCDMLTKKCYKNVLEYLDFKEYKATGQKVIDIANEYPYDIVIIRIDGHLTASIYGTIYDIWDCQYKHADMFWIK